MSHAARSVLRVWRRLTTPKGARRAGPGQRTLLACSGGADSCALVLALARPATRSQLVVAHVVHDLRPREQVLADRDAAQALARQLGLEFLEREVQVKHATGNVESTAREARYAALADMARACGAKFVATAHHADDQIETVLMSLLRGTGGAGIRGMAEKRRLRGSGSEVIWLIRPMLAAGDVGRTEAEQLCRDAGIEWQVDATNADTSRLRAALRHRVLPVLKELRPDLGIRAAATARQADSAARVIRRSAQARLRAGAAATSEPQWSWPRPELRAEQPAILSEMVRLARHRTGGGQGADRLTRRMLEAIARAIADDSTEPRTFVIGGESFGALEVRVTARHVRFAIASPASGRPLGPEH